MKFVFFPSAVLSSFALAAAAEPSRIEQLMAMDLGQVLEIEIATGSPLQLNKAPAVATVITAKDIELMGAQSLTQVLDTVPGMHVARNGQAMAPRFWFRGITTTYAPQTLMMVNGVSTKSVVRGDNHVVWGKFPVHSIERIEIIRGPGSALYGADAFAGVINIITKSYDDIEQTLVGGTLGSFNSYDFWLNSAIQAGQWQLAVNLELSQSDGFDSVISVDAQTALDQQGDFLFQQGVLPFNPEDVSHAPGSVNTGYQTADLWFSGENQYFRFDFGWQQKADVGTGQGIAEVLDPDGRFSAYKHIYKVALKPQQVNEALTLSSELHYYRSSQEVDKQLYLFPRGAFFGAFPEGFSGNPGWREDALKFELKASYSGFDNHQVTLGMGGQRQDLYEVTETKNFNGDFSPKPAGVVDVSNTEEVFMPEGARNNFYIYGQDIVQLTADWSLTTGVRYDYYSDFGGTFNPRLALVWSPSEEFNAKFLYGRAFRAPSFAETITVNNPISLGNPNVEPETIDTIEASFSYQYSAHLSLNANVFAYDINDLINFVPDFNGATFTAQNVGKRSGTGFELETRYQHSASLSVVANYSFVKAVDELLNDDVGEYPSSQAYLRANWQLQDHWLMHIQASIVGSRERIPGDVRAQLSGYESIDFGASYIFNNSGVTLSLLMKNAFDEDVREPSTGTTDSESMASIPFDLPQAGQSYYLTLSKAF